ncbi:hypothetical protein EDB83DRAFT_2575046, partial [Lactarius deliciosus]
ISDDRSLSRREGLFRSIRGRGRPLEWNSEEHNPFIARDEFLLNRIVQRQGAAPPWVEVQGELEAAIKAFRTALRRSWVRRAVCVLALTHSRLSLPSLADVQALRDEEWETRERAYHDSALAEVNSLVRNALTPYAVRRAYYVREVELAKNYDQSAEEIEREIERWPRGSRVGAKSETTPGGDAPVAGDVRDFGISSCSGRVAGRELGWDRSHLALNSTYSRFRGALVVCALMHIFTRSRAFMT